MKHFSPFFPGTVLLLIAAIALCFSLGGCTSTPTAQQEIAETVLVDAAVGVAIQNGTSDQSVWASRATQIVSIATELQLVASDSKATLPALSAALQPLLVKANLPPADQLAANMLIASLGQLIQQNIGNVNTTTQQAIQKVLSDVIAAASVYVPANR